MTRKFGMSVSALALACSMASACGTESIGSTRLTAPPLAAASRASKSSKVVCTTKRTSVDSGVFGPKGGTLIFGASRLIIPAGALKTDVMITATIPAGDANRVEFQPHGLVFARAAGLQLGTGDCSPDAPTAPSVVYLSETGEVIETIPAVYDPRWHTIAASIWHFSGYAIAF